MIGNEYTEKAKRRSGSRGCLTVIVILALIAAATYLCMFVWDVPAEIFRFFSGGTAPTTQAISGDPARFDPIAGYANAAAFAGEGARLLEINMYFVRSDGTMDLNAGYTPAPRVVYTFAVEVPRPDDAPPPGAGGANAGPWFQQIEVEAYRPGASRTTTTISGGVSTSFTYTNRGMTRRPGSVRSGQREFLTPPACDLTAFWRDALAQDAPPDGVATIDYEPEGYRFRITGWSVSLDYDAGCQRER
jgi:hypothetical protein